MHEWKSTPPPHLRGRLLDGRCTQPCDESARPNRVHRVPRTKARHSGAALRRVAPQLARTALFIYLSTHTLFQCRPAPRERCPGEGSRCDVPGIALAGSAATVWHSPAGAQGKGRSAGMLVASTAALLSTVPALRTPQQRLASHTTRPARPPTRGHDSGGGGAAEPRSATQAAGELPHEQTEGSKQAISPQKDWHRLASCAGAAHSAAGLTAGSPPT